MNQKILALALAASLLLNGFFFGGYWFAQRKAAQFSSRGNRIEAVAQSLNLTSRQKTLFQELKSQARQIRKNHRKRTISLQNDLWKLLATDSEKPGKTKRIIHEMTTEQEQYQNEITALIRQFLSGLDEGQRKVFIKISSDNKKLSALLSG